MSALPPNPAMRDVLAAAVAYLRAGLSPIPVRADGSKAPERTGWREYAARRPTTDELQSWFGNGHLAGVGIACGPASGNLAVLDFEDREPFERWRLAIPADTADLLSSCPVVETPSGGVHVWVRLPSPVPGGVLARDKERGVLVEIRGEGHQVLAPGCPAACHPSGRPYQFADRGWLDGGNTVVPLDVWYEWTLAAADLNEYAPPRQTHTPSGPADRLPGDRDPGADFNRRGTWEEAGLYAAGWTVASGSPDRGAVRRPGKKEGISGTVGIVTSRDHGWPLFYCFTTNGGEFGANAAYDRFGVYARLKHRGDFAAATRALLDAGYGDRRPRGREPHAAKLGRTPPAERPDDSPPSGPPPSEPTAAPPDYRLTNYRLEERDEGGKTRWVRVGLSVGTVAADLYAVTNNWPRRVGGALFCPAPGPEVRWLDSVDSLFAHLSAAVGGGRDNPVEWASGPSLPPKGEFFAHLAANGIAYDSVQVYPHHPELPDTYYLHPAPAGGDGSALDGLLSRFKPATPADRSLILAFLLTLVWGGPPGSRPAWLVTASDSDAKAGRGVGKTTLAKLAAQLVGGYVSAESNDDFPKLKTRILSAGARGKRVVLIDNVKSHKFSWGSLEAQITDRQVNGHAMYLGDGEIPNLLTWVLTVNGASLSKDLSERCIVIVIDRPAYSGNWEDDTKAYVETHRWAIIGDLLAVLRSDPAELPRSSRWGAWERAVLARVPDAAACQELILERQGAVDEDEEEAGRVRAEIEKVVRDAGYEPAGRTVQFDSGSVVEIVTRAKNERQTSTSASSYLRTLALPELVKKKRDGLMFWFWVGKDSDPDDDPLPATFDRGTRAIRVGVACGPIPL